MSKKLGIIGNYMTVIDSVTGVLEFGVPVADCAFVHVESASALILDPVKAGAKQEAKQYAYAVITDVNGDPFGSDALIRTFLLQNTGVASTQLGLHRASVLVDDNKVLVAGDADVEQVIATDAKTFTLPIITTEILGKVFLFRNNGADGAVAMTISPNAADAIHGTIANAAADSVAGGALDKDIVNTKATANKGDNILLVPVALTEWHIGGGVGIFASEA